MHRHGCSVASRITETELAARNRLADFQLRLELAVLYGVLRRRRLPRYARARDAVMRVAPISGSRVPKP
jgi:hypothetical protein